MKIYKNRDSHSIGKLGNQEAGGSARIEGSLRLWPAASAAPGVARVDFAALHRRSKQNHEALQPDPGISRNRIPMEVCRREYDSLFQKMLGLVRNRMSDPGETAWYRLWHRRP
jgi:hypothetical protein